MTGPSHQSVSGDVCNMASMVQEIPSPKEQREYVRRTANSIVDVLPPELLSRVFDFLSDERKNISACRLVCSAFKTLSSPFLITRIVFASRFDTITRLLEVVQHPYFRRYVTELVYDASRYDATYATYWQEYVDQCRESKRKLRDPEWARQEREEADLWLRLPPAQANEEDMHPAGTDFDASANAGAAEQQSPAPTTASESESDGDQDSDETDDEEPTDEYLDQAYGLGCHNSFPDYRRRWKYQRRVHKAEVPLDIVQHVLASLPKLRKFTFTDFRGLALRGESYNACCRRLFGNTLEPETLSTQADCAKAIHWAQYGIATSRRARIDELCVGGTAWELEPGSCLCDSDDVYVPAALLLTELAGLDEGLKSLTQVFANLRRLTLTFALGHSEAPDIVEFTQGGCEDLAEVLQPLKLSLEAAAPNLTQLSLSVLHLSEHKPGREVRQPARLPDGPSVNLQNTDHIPMNGAVHVFRLLLSPLHFRRIEHLSLAGWVFENADLKRWLYSHDASLRRLRLRNNFVIEESEGLATKVAILDSRHPRSRQVEDLKPTPVPSPTRTPTLEPTTEPTPSLVVKLRVPSAHR